MSADSWTLEEFEEYLESAPPIDELDVKFLDSLDWRQLRRFANHYNLNVRGDCAAYLSQIKAKRERAIARQNKTSTSSPIAAEEEAQRLSAKHQVEQSDKEEENVAVETTATAPSAVAHQREQRELDAKIQELKRLSQEIFTQHRLLRSPTTAGSGQQNRENPDTTSDDRNDGGMLPLGFTTLPVWQKMGNKV